MCTQEVLAVVLQLVTTVIRNHCLLNFCVTMYMKMYLVLVSVFCVCIVLTVHNVCVGLEATKGFVKCCEVGIVSVRLLQ